MGKHRLRVAQVFFLWLLLHWDVEFGQDRQGHEELSRMVLHLQWNFCEGQRSRSLCEEDASELASAFILSWIFRCASLEVMPWSQGGRGLKGREWLLLILLLIFFLGQKENLIVFEECNFSASDHRGHHVLTDSGPFRHKEVQKRRMSRSVALGRAPLLNCHFYFSHVFSSCVTFTDHSCTFQLHFSRSRWNAGDPVLSPGWSVVHQRTMGWTKSQSGASPWRRGDCWWH